MLNFARYIPIKMRKNAIQLRGLNFSAKITQANKAVSKGSMSIKSVTKPEENCLRL
jgi:hypothetical protein